MDDIVKFAQERIEKGSKSFASAARFFDPQIRASVYMLYCWCRFCDDEIDGQDVGAKLGEFSQDILTCAFAQRGEQDHGSDANHDTEDREQAA